MNTDETPIPEQSALVENPVPAARRAYSTAFFLPALLFIVDLIVIVILRVLIDTSKSIALAYIINFFPMYLIAFPCCVLAARLVPKMPPTQKALKPWELLAVFPVCQFLAILGNFIGIIVNAVLSSIIGVNTSATFLQEGVFGEESMLFAFIAVICAPIVEELLFRKLLIDRIRQYGNGTAIVISGLLFGLFHGNFTQFFYATMLGFLFAFIYTRTGKIHYTIILHMALNFWGSALPMLVTRNLDKEAFFKAVQDAMDALQKAFSTGGQYINLDTVNQELTTLFGDIKPLLIYSACNYLLAFLGIIMLIILRKRFRIDPPVTPLPTRTHLNVIFLNLGVLFAVGICVFQFINQIFGVL